MGKRFPVRLTGALMILLAAAFISSPFAGFGLTVEELDQKIKDREILFYREFFNQILYEPFASLLRFDRIRDRIFSGKHEALDVNPFDEVPDSAFFTNRHAKNRFSISDLKQGPDRGEGPNPQGPWQVLKGKTAGVSAGFLIKDSKGDRYLLKFDPKDNPEMATSAEVISHKFFHSFGYNVAEYYLIYFNPDILNPDPKATYYNEDGFKKPLTEEALQELLDRVPKFKGGVVRASASKILEDAKGYMDFDGRRESDPDDFIPHEDRRSMRALRIFGSWLNHYDIREGNTLDIIEVEDGKPFLKHYLIDFGSTLGSAASHPKVPAAGHEHIVDWFEVGKTAPTLKVVEKPWEKRWDEFNRQITYPELGYFDNFHFEPEDWKTQLPYEVFNRITRSDAFWAAKILMSYSDEDIRAIVETARYSDPQNASLLSEILITRRDLIGRYWFSRVTPLDQIRLFQLDGGQYEIRFADLMVQHGFAQADGVQYRYRIGDTHQEFSGNRFSFNVNSGETDRVVIRVQAKYDANGAWSEPPLEIRLAKSAEDASLRVAQIDHGV